VSPAGTRISVDPSLLLQQTGAHRVVLRRRPPAHRRADADRPLHERKYKLDELITRRVPLRELNEAFDLMVQGEVKRSVVVY